MFTLYKLQAHFDVKDFNFVQLAFLILGDDNLFNYDCAQRLYYATYKKMQ